MRVFYTYSGHLSMKYVIVFVAIITYNIVIEKSEWRY